MIKINLLDWRQAQRDKRQKDFGVALALTAVLGAAVTFGINAKVTGDVEFQQSRNAQLKREIKDMDKAIAEIKTLDKVKQDLLARMRIIEELQRSRTEIVHFFDEVVTTIPDGLYLKELSQNGRTTTINGIAESNGRVSSYIRNLDASDWFEDARLIVIKAEDKNRRRYSDFKLQFRTTKQSSADQEDVG